MSRNHIDPAAQAATCKSVVESLPWLLNGTLANDETAMLVVHVRDCSDCRHEVREALEAAQLMTAHLPTLVIAEHALGLPTALSSEMIEAHLAACPSCRHEASLVRMDAELDLDDTEPARIFSFPSRSTKPARPAVGRGDWTRWAAAAGLMAALGGSWMVGRMDDGTEQTAATQVARQQTEAAVEPEAVEIVFSDGFESGDLKKWTVHGSAG